MAGNPYDPIPGGYLNPLNWLVDLAEETFEVAQGAMGGGSGQ